jgi:chemotaxis methyl-accepting protein methylase
LNDFTDYAGFLSENRTECVVFCNSLLISHSEFFRYPFSYEVLQNVVIPEMTFQNKNKADRTIRIWSMACAGGQEVYSLSILLHEFNAKSNHKIKYHILGTDISERAIEMAQKGAYDMLSVKNVSFGRMKECFTASESAFSINPVLKENVNFANFDLLSDKNMFPPESIFGGFDIIICSNILYYYTNDYQGIIIKKIRQSLNKGGCLITDPSEKNIIEKHGFTELVKDACVFSLI